jgi:hypothetical protein
MVLRIKSLDTSRNEENTQENKARMGKETEKLQDLHCTGEARKLYSKVKETKKEFKPRVNICKAKDVSIICDQTEVLA